MIRNLCGAGCERWSLESFFSAVPRASGVPVDSEA